MNKTILTILCNVVLLLTFCLPSDADTTIGLISTASLSGATEANIIQLSKELSKLAGEPVKVRRFENDASLNNWLLRFQEIDAAVVPPSFIKQHPAGTLNKIYDLHAQESSQTPLALVVRSNLGKRETEQIKKTFLALGTSKDGRMVLTQMGLAGITLPGKALSKETLSPEPKTTLQRKPAPTTKTKPASTSQILAQKEVEVKPAVTAPAVTSESTPEESQRVKSFKIEEAATTTPSLAPEDKQIVSTVDNQPESKSLPAEPKEQEPQPTAGQKKARAEESASRPESNSHSTLFILLVIFAAIIFKMVLFAIRRKKTKTSSFIPEKKLKMDTSFRSEDSEPQLSPPAELSAQKEEVIEEGQLSFDKVPQLLKRCVELSRPVVLHITKGSCEKLVYFADGKVCGALTQHSTMDEPNLQWNKLGNLLVRESLITGAERDRAMALVAEEPGLRFGEALLKLGLIDLAGLRHALTRQAKVTIYSLILYPEGHYLICAGEESLPPEESVSLEITALLNETSHHQTEWDAIRQSLPNLNTALELCPDSRNKLGEESLSPQQEEILARIDGNRTIHEICVESSMMDYEVYRFLYSMVKSGILK